jgi:hypothetical protein
VEVLLVYQWLVFAHVLGVFGFLLAHGASAAVAFKLRGEREVERIRVLLDLSRDATAIANVALLVLLAAGIAAGFMGGWWGQLWIWSALGLLILINVAMVVVASGPLIRIRQLVGAAVLGRAQTHSAPPSNTTGAAVDQQLAVQLAAVNPLLLTLIGGGGLALILWLMLFKPF